MNKLFVLVAAFVVLLFPFINCLQMGILKSRRAGKLYWSEEWSNNSVSISNIRQEFYDRLGYCSATNDCNIEYLTSANNSKLEIIRQSSYVAYKFSDERWNNRENRRNCPIFYWPQLYKIDNQKPPIKLSIYYETLCPDSVLFFRKQLKKTYEKIGSCMIIDFVPFGIAHYKQVGEDVILHCQHGTRECNGNKYHACALAQNNGQDKDVQFLGCSMSRANPASPVELEKCAHRVGINFDAIKLCFESDEGNQLIAKYGDRTEALMSNIKRYVPTLTVNDEYNQIFQENAEYDLLNTVCQLLDPKPVNCSTKSVALN